jgi:hypothetical protein
VRRIAQLASLAALVGTISPPVLYFVNRIALDVAQGWMLAATVVWFVATPLWMDR